MKPIFDNFAAPKIDRRKFLLGVLFASAAGVAAWRKPDLHLDYLGREKLDELVPKSIGSWNFVAASGLVVPPNDQLSKAVYSQLLTRVYWDGQNSPMMLLIAQSGSQTGFDQRGSEKDVGGGDQRTVHCKRLDLEHARDPSDDEKCKRNPKEWQ
jgi:hypothetical protein